MKQSEFLKRLLRSKMEYQRLFSLAETGEIILSRPPPRCVHLGDPIIGQEVSRRGLSVLRQWFVCEAGLGESGAAAPCRTCNSSCPSIRLKQPE